MLFLSEIYIKNSYAFYQKFIFNLNLSGIYIKNPFFSFYQKFTLEFLVCV